MSSAAAKKPNRSRQASGPSWSRVEGRGAAGGAKGAAKGTSKRSTSRSKLKAVPRAAARAAPRWEIPAPLRRELGALLLAVVGALVFVGLIAWAGGGGGIVGIAGKFLAQLFGVAAWLVPVGLLVGAGLLLLGARTPLGESGDSRWLSPAVPIGFGAILLGFMGFTHLLTNGQAAAEAGQGGGYLGLALSTFLSD